MALEEIRHLSSLLVEHGIQPSVDLAALEPRSPQEVLSALYKVEDQHRSVLEDEFARAQHESDDAIAETIRYLEALAANRELDIPDYARPAYLEWAVWRALLSFNSLAAKPSASRYFILDADLKPADHAPSRRPDMMLEYDEFSLVGEVTLTTSSRQVATEGEPVQRHVADAVARAGDKRVYGLFVAPSIDNNTAFAFGSVWYRGDEPCELNIVPIRVSWLIRILDAVKAKRREPRELRDLLDQCLVTRNAPPPKWLADIESAIVQWA